MSSQTAIRIAMFLNAGIFAAVRVLFSQFDGSKILLLFAQKTFGFYKLNITAKLYGKRDAFGFHIVNFPFMSSNIPSAPSYGVYVSQLIRYAHCCSNYSDFLSCHRALVTRLL